MLRGTEVRKISISLPVKYLSKIKYINTFPKSYIMEMNPICKTSL